VSGLLRKAVFIVKSDENSNYCDILNSKGKNKEEGRKEKFPPGTDLNWHLPYIIKIHEPTANAADMLQSTK
jgi:hypothetical protein